MKARQRNHQHLLRLNSDMPNPMPSPPTRRPRGAIQELHRPAPWRRLLAKRESAQMQLRPGPHLDATDSIDLCPDDTVEDFPPRPPSSCE